MFFVPDLFSSWTTVKHWGRKVKIDTKSEAKFLFWATPGGGVGARGSYGMPGIELGFVLC